MSRIKSFVLLAGAAMSVATGASLAQTSADSYRADLALDAQSRSSLLAAGGSVHHENGGFGFDDASGNNSLNFIGYGRFVWYFNFGDEDGRGENNDFVHGGQTTDVMLITHGTVASKSFGYYVQFGASGVGSPFDDSNSDSNSEESSGAGLAVQDMFFTYMFEDGVYARFGQGRPQQGLEANTHEAYQQRLNRSLANEPFEVGRTHFIAVGGTLGQVEWQVGFNDGHGAGGADFFSSTESDIGLGGSVFFYFQGTPQDFPGQQWNGAPRAVSQSAFRGSPRAFRGGINFQYDTGGETGIGTSEFDAWKASAGLEYRDNGFSARGYLYANSVDPDGGDDFTSYAASVTVGYFIAPDVEIYGGWDGFFFDSDIADEDNQNFIVVGLNWFPFQGPAVRFTVEGIYSLDTSGDFLSNISNSDMEIWGSRYNILGDSDDGEFGIGFGASVVN